MTTEALLFLDQSQPSIEDPRPPSLSQARMRPGILSCCGGTLYIAVPSKNLLRA